MNNIKPHIIKYITERTTNLVLLTLMVVALFYGLGLTTPPPIVTAIGILIGFLILQKITDKSFNKWNAPDMNTIEKKKFLNFGTVFDVILSVALIILFIKFTSMSSLFILIVIFSILLLIKEVKKRKAFNKELKKEVDVVVDKIPEEENKIINEAEKKIPEEEIKQSESNKELEPEIKEEIKGEEKNGN